MSLLLGQQDDVDSRTRSETRQRPSTQEPPHLAGLPLLLRMPDLDGARRSQSKRNPTAAASSPKGEPTTDGSDAVATHKPADVESASKGKSGWRNFTWQLLVLILLPVLFLAAWFVLSSPKSDSSTPAENEGLASPDIELGEPVSPDAMFTQQASDAPNGSPPATSPPTEIVEAPKWVDSQDLADASSSPAPEVSPPPAPSDSSATQSPPRQEEAPPLVEGGSFQPGPPANSGVAPSAQTAPASAYPSTHPSTYQYPDTSGDRVGQRPAVGGFTYPSTGAPPQFERNQGPAAGAMPR